MVVKAVVAAVVRAVTRGWHRCEWYQHSWDMSGRSPLTVYCGIPSVWDPFCVGSLLCGIPSVVWDPFCLGSLR